MAATHKCSASTETSSHYIEPWEEGTRNSSKLSSCYTFGRLYTYDEKCYILRLRAYAPRDALVSSPDPFPYAHAREIIGGWRKSEGKGLANRVGLARQLECERGCK